MCKAKKKAQAKVSNSPGPIDQPFSARNPRPTVVSITANQTVFSTGSFSKIPAKIGVITTKSPVINPDAVADV